MNHPAELHLFPYRYFPYELELAKREILALGGEEPIKSPRSFMASGLKPEAADRLTYFSQVVTPQGERIIPLQALLEESDRNGRTNGARRRQHTRYSAHGIHEYRGKFNPQVVRSVCNMVGLRAGSRLWDPFCGSGTVLLEAFHGRMSALGTDRNPLGVLIANAKIAALSATPKALKENVERFASTLRERGDVLEDENVTERQIEQVVGRGWTKRIPSHEYLGGWIARPVLAQLVLALDLVDAKVPRALQGLFRVFVSEIVRAVSWQDPGDLRIRRRKDAFSNYPATSRIAEHATEQVRRITAAKECLRASGSWVRAVEGDSQDTTSLGSSARRYLEAGVDLVVTSPPYATALPYIDTQRLSLALLGLSTPQRIRTLEFEILGSREIATGVRRATETRLRSNSDKLPDRVAELCGTLLGAVSLSDGFRRINTPSLVYRYFAGMKRCVENAARALRRGGSLVLLVGPSRSTLGGRTYAIDTPKMLADIGEASGLKLVESIPLQAYHRYSLHRHNSIREESLVILRKTR